MKKSTILLTLLLITSFTMLYPQTYTFDFSMGDNGFVGGVSDFGVEQSGQHQFTFVNKPYEVPLDTTKSGQYISGINPSDDLFMYMKKKITGLLPFTSYQATFIVEFASKYPTNAIGAGGPPGEGVTMKAGLTLIEPDTMIINEGMPFVVMNIDKGNQCIPGVDMDTIGHVGVSDTTTVWALKTNGNTSHPFSFTTDNTGAAWVIIGTDSGFESQTELYYSKVTVDFTRISDVTYGLRPENISVYPNPCSGSFNVTSSGPEFEMLLIYDMSGRLCRSYRTKNTTMTINLPPSAYLLKITSGKSTVVKRVVVE